MRKHLARLRAWFWFRLIAASELLFGFESWPCAVAVERCADAEVSLYDYPMSEKDVPDIELESFVIVITAPIWIWFFVVMFLVGWFGDWRARG